MAALFVLAGALFGCPISYATTRTNRRWGRARTTPEGMRIKVAQSGEYELSQPTSLAAGKIRPEWAQQLIQAEADLRRGLIQALAHSDDEDASYEVDSPMNYVKSRQRVADHGEVFTPLWLVEAMLDLVKEETERIDSRFLEPTCGSGNFLVRILQRKIAAVELKYGKSEFERRHYALLALMCTYGVELLADNIAECRANMLEILADFLKLSESDELYRAASYVLSQNIVHGDALKMRTSDDHPITFAEWGYLGKGKFQRRDFRLDILTGSSAFSAEDSLFAHLGKHEIFTPTKTYPQMTVSELAAFAPADTRCVPR